MSRLVAIALLVWGNGPSANANNTRFLPGDAFFFTQLNQTQFAALRRDESPVFLYGSPSNAGRGCGDYGWERLQIVEMPKAEKDALVKAFQLMKPSLERDANGRFAIHVLIYNEDYDWQRFGLGLQYNENWVDESVGFGVPREFLSLESFLRAGERGADRFIERNWRDSTLVPPLRAEPSPITLDRQQQGEQPVRLKRPRLYVVLPNRDWEAYFSREKDVDLCIIRSGQLEQWTRRQREWKRKD